jgi:hypothetical protein
LPFHGLTDPEPLFMKGVFSRVSARSFTNRR